MSRVSQLVESGETACRVGGSVPSSRCGMTFESVQNDLRVGAKSPSSRVTMSAEIPAGKYCLTGNGFFDVTIFLDSREVTASFRAPPFCRVHTTPQ